MSRFFYTDPLAAAWMAKHFGMRLETPRLSQPDVMKEVNPHMLATHLVAACASRFTTRFYLHPDSLP